MMKRGFWAAVSLVALTSLVASGAGGFVSRVLNADGSFSIVIRSPSVSLQDAEVFAWSKMFMNHKYGYVAENVVLTIDMKHRQVYFLLDDEISTLDFDELSYFANNVVTHSAAFSNTLSW